MKTSHGQLPCEQLQKTLTIAFADFASILVTFKSILTIHSALSLWAFLISREITNRWKTWSTVSRKMSFLYFVEATFKILVLTVKIFLADTLAIANVHKQNLIDISYFGICTCHNHRRLARIHLDSTSGIVLGNILVKKFIKM